MERMEDARRRVMEEEEYAERMEEEGTKVAEEKE